MLSALKISKVSSAAVWLLLSVGCATYPDQTDPKVPASLEPLFATCASGDGALALKGFQGEDLLGSGEVEWVAEEGGWTAQMLNPLGQSMVTISMEDSALAVTGPLAEKIPTLVVREDGFLEIESYFVGLRAQELPCFLSGHIPETWRESLKASVTKDGKQRMWFDDEVRIARVVAVEKEDKLHRFCTQVTWGSWFTKRKVMFCQNLQAPRKASLSGLRDYRLEWLPL